MTSSRRKLIHIALGILAGSALTGCIVVPTGPHRQGGWVQQDTTYVTVAPPAAQVEVVIAPPGPGYFWISGFWNWIGGRHVWVQGRWEPQRAGYQWSPHQWRQDGRGWRLAPGRWDRR